MNFQEYFGRQVCIKRVGKRITQEELAEKVGKAPRHMSDIENGKVNIKLDLLVKLVHVLEISFDDLIEEYYKLYNEETI